MKVMSVLVPFLLAVLMVPMSWATDINSLEVGVTEAKSKASNNEQKIMALEESLTGGLPAERAARIDADAILQTQIDDERLSREAAVVSLQESLDAVSSGVADINVPLTGQGGLLSVGKGEECSYQGSGDLVCEDLHRLNVMPGEYFTFLRGTSVATGEGFEFFINARLDSWGNYEAMLASEGTGMELSDRSPLVSSRSGEFPLWEHLPVGVAVVASLLKDGSVQMKLYGVETVSEVFAEPPVPTIDLAEIRNSSSPPSFRMFLSIDGSTADIEQSAYTLVFEGFECRNWSGEWPRHPAEIIEFGIRPEGNRTRVTIYDLCAEEILWLEYKMYSAYSGVFLAGGQVTP